MQMSGSEWLLNLEEISIAVTHKKVKRINLVVCAPAGNVRISAPRSLGRREIRAFAEARIEWIRKQISEIRRAARSADDFTDQYLLWGKPLCLRLHPGAESAFIETDGDSLHIHTPKPESPAIIAAMLTAWHCRLVRAAAGPLIGKWLKPAAAPEPVLTVRKMKTRWGSCRPGKRRISLNSDLAMMPPECLEYVIVHELAHFTHADHGPGFRALMDRLLPGWREIRRKMA